MLYLSDRARERKGGKHNFHKYLNNKEKHHTSQEETTEKAENMMACKRSVSDINRFIYASSVQQPNADLLGSDSEYSAI